MRFRKYFITGLIAIAPVGLSLLFIRFLIVRIGNILGQIFQRIPILSTLPSLVISLLGFIAILFLIYFIGLLTSSFLGRFFLGFWEGVLLRFPVIRSVYVTFREVFSKLLGTEIVGKPVFVPYPREGVKTLVFLTSDEIWTITSKEGKEKKGISVFLPTNPNPTTGLYVIVPEDEITDPHLSKEWGLKMAASSGIIYPDLKP